jgi:uncharacterized protein YdcH (DUF465 family)
MAAVTPMTAAALAINMDSSHTAVDSNNPAAKASAAPTRTEIPKRLLTALANLAPLLTATILAVVQLKTPLAVGCKADNKVNKVEDNMTRVEDNMTRVKDNMTRMKDNMTRVKDDMARVEDNMARVGDNMVKAEMMITTRPIGTKFLVGTPSIYFDVQFSN